MGDEVSVDNSVYLAFQTMHRHQVDPDFEPWEQFTEGGQPIYPQRPRKIGPIMARQGSGVSQSGRFAGKMIVVQTLMDEAAYPWQALWYRKKVEAQLGDRMDDQYRLWFVEHAMHTGGAEPTMGMGLPDVFPSRRTRMISYLGVLQQALRDVVDWVEHGLAPPASTSYTYVDGQVHVPDTAAARRGPQAVVRATANGGERADVGVGEPVRFRADIEVPVGAGGIVAVEWDFEGTGDFPVVEEGLDAALARYTSTVTHTFTEPGTYFPAVRVTNQRSVDAGTRHCRILNLGTGARRRSLTRGRTDHTTHTRHHAQTWRLDCRPPHPTTKAPCRPSARSRRAGSSSAGSRSRRARSPSPASTGSPPSTAPRRASPTRRCASATVGSSTSGSTTCSLLARRLVTDLGVGVVALDAPEHGDRVTDPEAQARALAAIRDGDPDARRARYGKRARAAMFERAKVHVAEWRLLLDALQTEPRWAAGPFGWWGVSMGTTHGVPLAAQDDRIAAAVFGLNALPAGDEEWGRQAAAVTVPVLFLAQWHDELMTRDTMIALWETFGSSEKTMHVNPGGHVQVPRFERQASVDFFRRHLLP